MLSYISKTPGIGGTIKNSSEDFLVEEIALDGKVLELGKPFPSPETEKRAFVHFILEKKDWSSEAAVKTIAKKLGISFRRFNFAGSKDKTATTTQIVSCFEASKEEIEALHLKDMKILGAWYRDGKANMGDLLGNRFGVVVRDCGGNAEKKVNSIYSELDGKFPNYFGGQRFGSSRKNTHTIGEKMMKNDYEGAALSFLCDTEGEDNAESSSARNELKSTLDYEKALKTFPQYLRLERSMLATLAKNSNEYIAAFRALPRSTLLMFIHAFQSHIFNICLSDRIKEVENDWSKEDGKGKEMELEEGEYFCGESSFGFPDLDVKLGTANGKQKHSWLAAKIVGYESTPNERETKVLESFAMTKEHFKLRRIPEISSKGAYRTLFAPLKDFSFENNTFRFSLQSGSYATTALREFLDKSKD